MESLPRTADIRQFLFDFFNDEELSTLCFDFFPQVHDNFAAGMTKQQKIIMLLEYCQHQEIVPNLIAALQRARPEPYKKRFPQALQVEARPELEKPARDPKRVFISHAHEDAEFAHRLAGDLQKRGWRVWIAPNSIRPGEKWVEAINRGLEECGVFVLALTPSAVKSHWVMDETNVAIEYEHEGQIRFVPLLVAPCDVRPLWRAYQRVPFQSDYGRGLTELLDTLEPERRARREREAQEQAAREKAEQAEREMEGRRQAAQTEAERQLSRSPRVMRLVALPVVGVLVGVLLIGLLVWGRPFLSPKPRIEWVDIPAGEFLMGSDPKVDRSAKSNEQPQHKVYLDAYKIGKYEITNAQYAQCVRATACPNPSDTTRYSDPNYANHPVVYVTWSAARGFCQWVGGHLPTEAQWEKAARGGLGEIPSVAWKAGNFIANLVPGRIYPWGNDAFTCQRANCCCCLGDTMPVGQHSPAGDSLYGVADMTGNVSEWVADWYDDYPSEAQTNPLGPKTGRYKIHRGGDFYSHESYCTVATRGTALPIDSFELMGFRCAVGGVALPISPE